jgi:hypothetical protein
MGCGFQGRLQTPILNENRPVEPHSCNTTLRDVTTMGFQDGIRAGANAPAHSNVLVNIIGDTSSCVAI